MKYVFEEQIIALNVSLFASKVFDSRDILNIILENQRCKKLREVQVQFLRMALVRIST
jgi:hypothetical protein